MLDVKKKEKAFPLLTTFKNESAHTYIRTVHNTGINIKKCQYKPTVLQSFCFFFTDFRSSLNYFVFLLLLLLLLDFASSSVVFPKLDACDFFRDIIEDACVNR